MSLPPSFFDHLEDRLNLAVYDTNQEYRRVSVESLIQSLDDPPAFETPATETPKPQMSTKLQGLAAKIALFKHTAEFEAEKLDSKIEGAAARLPVTFSGAHTFVDGLTKQVDDVDSLMTEIQKTTNGG
jgi:hypothetical protein